MNRMVGDSSHRWTSPWPVHITWSCIQNYAMMKVAETDMDFRHSMMHKVCNSLSSLRWGLLVCSRLNLAGTAVEIDLSPSTCRSWFSRSSQPKRAQESVHPSSIHPILLGSKYLHHPGVHCCVAYLPVLLASTPTLRL